MKRIVCETSRRYRYGADMSNVIESSAKSSRELNREKSRGYLYYVAPDVRHAVRAYLKKIGADPSFSCVIENDDVMRIRVDGINRVDSLADYIYNTLGDSNLVVDAVDDNIISISTSNNGHNGNVDSASDVFGSGSNPVDVNELRYELYTKVIEFMQTPRCGFDENEAKQYSRLDVHTEDDQVIFQVGAELGYESMEMLKEVLDMIIQKVDPDSYFEQVDPGIMEAWLDSKYVQCNTQIESYKYVKGSSLYDKYMKITVDGQDFSVHYNEIDCNPDADAFEMLKEFRAQVSEIHPYDDADYISARIANGLVTCQKNGGKILESYSYEDADAMGVENSEWCQIIVEEAARRVYQMNADTKPVMIHNAEDVQCSDNYFGGAYDLEGEGFFTKDDLVEFDDSVIDGLNNLYSDTFKIDDSYIEDNVIYLSVESSEGNWAEGSVKVDMRKIRKPSDILKYSDSMVNKLKESLDDLYKEINSSTDLNDVDSFEQEDIQSDSNITYLDESEEEVEIQLDAYIELDSEGSWEYEDKNYTWARSDRKDGDWYSDEYPSVKLCGVTDAVEYVDNLMETMLPMTEGKFHVKGDVTLVFSIDGIQSEILDAGFSEEEGFYKDEEIYTDYAEVEFNFAESKIENFKCSKL